MLQLTNKTPFAATMSMFPNEDGIDTLYMIVKASFHIGAQLTLTDEQAEPVAADEYWTEPGKSSIKYASDFHVGKPATDVIMHGHACAHDQQETTQLDVHLSVGHVAKTVRVYGDRQWRDGRMTRPTPFKTMPMVYEKAYGGVHFADGQLKEAEARNPVGRGFVGARNTQELNGLALPNLEDPNQLIQSIEDRPAPACFAACAPNWLPRAGYAGTYDDVWQSTRAPYLPQDFDKRFLNAAHPELIYPGFLQGGELVHITNMHPSGELQFEVPQVKLLARVLVAGKEEMPDFYLETLHLEPNQMKMSMLWRASMRCDKTALKISEIKLSMQR